MSQPEFEYLGPYRVESTLGRGGMGTVYKGVHAKSGEAVAIKVIATGVANQSRFRRRFATEVETLKRLKHPNIVSLVGYGEEQGLLFYSMEYVEGHSLHDHLRQHSALAWEEVLEVGVQTTAALKHAHDLGIIHRDLKPANLMLNAEGQVKLTDFGIAKLFGSTDMTAAGSVIGTADYMPPEQAEGKAVTTRSDLYSLGGVLYALICGKAPFSGKSVPEVLYSVRYNPVPDLQQRAPDAPGELCELIHQLLAKNPQDRPPTALVVGNRLKSLQQGLKRNSKKSEAARQEPDPAAQVGTRLTSLDLSDVDDEDLKLTGEVEEESALQSSSVGADMPLGTHDQQTMLAPGASQKSVERSSVAEHAPTSLVEPDADEDEDEEVASEFSHAGIEAQEAQEEEEEPITSGGPSHYTPVTEDETKPFSFGAEEEEPQPGVDWLHYGAIAGIAACLIGCVGLGWWMLQPKSADQVYQSIATAIDSGDESQLLAAKGDMQEFLTRFPADERCPDIQLQIDDLELIRQTRVLRRRAARIGGNQELSAIEQAFLDCMLARERDFDEFTSKVAAFLGVYGALTELPRDEARLIELAEYASSVASRTDVGTSQAAEELASLIQSAEDQMSDEQLQTFYKNLESLYGDKAWAREQMQRIRNKSGAE